MKKIGFITGMLAFVVLMLLPTPGGMNDKAWDMVAVISIMAIWWLTEATELSITALLPIVLLPALDITPAKQVTLSYANETIFLFLGGFMIALALEKSNLHQRFALHTIKLTGTSPARMVLGIMMTVYFLSMWVSNTATVLMIIPICLAIINQFPDSRSKDAVKFSKVLLLSVAYAASIGGVGTLVGTPPNIIYASMMSKYAGTSVNFADWMITAVPITFIILILAWILLTVFVYPLHKSKLPLDKAFIDEHIKALGKISPHEKRAGTVFLLVALMWTFRSFIPLPFFTEQISDTTIAILGGVSLFLIPTGNIKGEKLLDWDSAVKLPWGILLLFGGGLALSQGFVDSGLSDCLASSVASLKGLNIWLILIITVTFIVFLTEIMSNTATATLFIPIALTVASALNVPMEFLAVPITMGVSFAFMLPIATPPNAIVFGYKYLTIRDMAKSGFWLNIICIIVLFVAFFIMYH